MQTSEFPFHLIVLFLPPLTTAAASRKKLIYKLPEVFKKCIFCLNMEPFGLPAQRIDPSKAVVRLIHVKAGDVPSAPESPPDFLCMTRPVGDSGFGQERRSEGRTRPCRNVLSRGAMRVGSLPLKSQLSHAAIFLAAFPCLCFWRDKDGRGFPQICFSYWGVFLCVPSPRKPEICTERIKGRAKCK